jgi:Domain of unknown function (DUF4382)
MKKTTFLFVLACLALLIWAGSCKSPSSSEKLASLAANESQDNSGSSGSGSSGSGSGGSGTGFLRLTIKDSPIEDAKFIMLTIGKIRVHQACETETEDSCFITVAETFNDGKPFDLLKLKNYPITFTSPLPAGTYNQIRMDVIKGEIVFGAPGAADPLNDKTYPLDVPSDEVKTHLHFVVAAGGMTSITLDLDAENSIHIVKKGNKDEYQLRPVVNVVSVQNPTR